MSREWFRRIFSDELEPEPLKSEKKEHDLILTVGEPVDETLHLTVGDPVIEYDPRHRRRRH